LRNVSQKWADEIIPKYIPAKNSDKPKEDGSDVASGFFKRVKHAKKVVIKNICGTIEDL